MSIVARRGRFAAGAAMLCALAPPLASQPAPPRARLTAELRLDATKEDFPFVGRVYVGPSGEMLVPIFQDAQVRFYDSTGRLVSRVGRRGAGPGEFQTINVIGWVGDTAWVNDMEQRRLTFISPAGKLLRTTPYEHSSVATGTPASSWPPGSFSRFYPGGITPDGAFIGEGYISLAGVRGGPRTHQRALLRRPSTGAMRVIAQIPSYEDERWFMTAGPLGHSIPFAASPITALSVAGDRFAMITSTITSRDGGEFTVTALRTTGDTMFVRTFPYRGVPIPARVRDSAAASYLVINRGSSEGGAGLGPQFQKLALARMPAIYPGVQTVRLGLDNTVWVGLRPIVEGAPVIVLNGRGDPVATVMVPKGSRILQATASRIWMAETDDDGLSSVVRYRVAGISCGPISCR